MLFKRSPIVPFLQYVIKSQAQKVSLKFQFKIPPDHLLYHFENAYFVRKQKHAVFMHVSLNANELLLPAPFSGIGLCPYSSYLRYS